VKNLDLDHELEDFDGGEDYDNDAGSEGWFPLTASYQDKNNPADIRVRRFE
jgi:hypothetical protein